ncbi:MAG: hypothetical protein V4487_08790 [Chlamydiota bacterium]
MLIYFALAFCSLHAADCSKKIELEERIYVMPHQVKIDKNGIFILTQGREIKTSALYRNDDGLYFTDMWVADCDKGYWECKHCSHCNPNHKFWCEVCFK